MPQYLIDVNLPYYFGRWNTKDYVHQIDINSRSKDKDIWQYACRNDLVIITKDSDFSNRILLAEPPPKVIHIRTGNMDMSRFHDVIGNCRDEVEKMISNHKLVSVYESYLEGIA